MHIKYKFLWYISKKKGHGTTNLISWISCTRVLNKLELPFLFIQMSFHNTWSTTLLCGKLTHLPLNFYFVINLLMSFTIAFMSQLLTIYHFAMLKSSITFIVKQTVLIRNLLLESNTFTTCIYTYLHHYIYILMCPQSFQIRPKFCNIWSKKKHQCLRRRDWFISICDV